MNNIAIFVVRHYTPKGVYLPISKLHSVLALANLFAHNNITISYYVQVNSLYGSNQVQLRNGQIDTYRGTIYFAADGTSARNNFLRLLIPWLSFLCKNCVSNWYIYCYGII